MLKMDLCLYFPVIVALLLNLISKYQSIFLKAELVDFEALPSLIFLILAIIITSFIFLWIQVLKLILLVSLLSLFLFAFSKLSFIIELFDIFLWIHLSSHLHFLILFQVLRFQWIFKQAHFLKHSKGCFQPLTYKVKIFSQQIQDYFLLLIIKKSFFSFHVQAELFHL